MRRTTKSLGEKVLRDIMRVTRKQYFSEEKIRIVLDSLRGEDSIAELYRREAMDLKEVVAEQTLELRLLKKACWAMGATKNEVCRIRESGNHPFDRRQPSVGASNAGQAGYPPHHVLSLV